MDRGKVMTYAADLDEAGAPFGPLPWTWTVTAFRTAPCPVSHIRTEGAYFTRGTSPRRIREIHRYSEEAGQYHVANMERLLTEIRDRQISWFPPARCAAMRKTPARRFGAICYGSTDAGNGRGGLEICCRNSGGGHMDTMRVRGFPFSDEVIGFIRAHETVFIVEQNRDAQLRTLVLNEGGVDPAKLVAVLNYDGSPITARFIAEDISARMRQISALPAHQAAE